MTRIADAAVLFFLVIAVPSYAEETCRLPDRQASKTVRIGSWGAHVIGSGNMTTQTRAVSGFDSVRVKVPFIVDARAGEREHVTVRIDDNLHSMLEVKVVNGVLTIALTSDASFTTSSLPLVTVHYTKLTAVAVEGSGDFFANNMRAADGFDAAK